MTDLSGDGIPNSTHSFRSRVLVVCLAVGAIGAAASVTTAVPAFATTPDVSQTFSVTNSIQTWTVPLGVTQIYVDLAGGQGGASYGGGGGGAELTGVLPVTPGDTLNLVVGGYGGNGIEYGAGAGGGGGSFIYTTPDLSGILAAAGGGGGAGSNTGASTASTTTSGTNGGNNGGAGGTDGYGGQASSAGGGGGLLGDGASGYGGQSVADGASGGQGGGNAGGGGFGGGAGTPTYAGGGGGGYSGGGGGNYDGNNNGGDGFITIFYNSVITSVSPDTALIGDPVTIDGSGLAGATVTIGGVTAAVVSSSDTQVVVAVPALSPVPAGVQTVDVSTAGGVTLPAVGAFTYVPPPTVNAVNPDSIPVGTGPTVTITGAGFTGASAVDFGTTPATSFTVLSDTSITAAVPSSLPWGAVDTSVTTVDGTSASSTADQLTVLPPAPTVTGVSPTIGPAGGGTDLTITGTNFDAVTDVTIGSTPVTSFTVVSSTTITALTGASSAGEFMVAVTALGGTNDASPDADFTYVAAPTVSAVSPTSGPVAGGTSVTITGTGFTGASAVDFGTAGGTYTVNSDTSITAVTPTSSAGTVDITVTTVGGVSATSAADRLTFDAASTPAHLGETGVDAAMTFSIAATLLVAGLIAGAFALIERRRRRHGVG